MPHGEVFPRWWKTAPIGMLERPKMCTCEGAVAENLIALGDLFIYCEVEVWEGGTPGLNDQPHVIQTSLHSETAEVSSPIITDEIDPSLIPDVLEMTANDLLIAHLDYINCFSHRVFSFLSFIFLFCFQISPSHLLVTRIANCRHFHHAEEAHVHPQLSPLDAECAMMGEQ